MLRRLALGLAASVLSLVSARPAAAQRTPPPAPPAPPAPSEADVLGAEATPKAFSIEVSDPMLEPVGPPSKVLTSWRSTLGLISARSANLRIAVQEVERAEGLARQALGAALPTLNAAGSMEVHLIRRERQGFDPRTGTIGVREFPLSPQYLMQLSASQPVLAPRAWYAIGTARKNVAAARIGVEEQRRQIAAQVANAIVGVVTNERVAEVNRVGLRGALQTLELTRRRARLGVGTRLDVVRAEQDVTLARLTLVQGDEALRQAREALGLALGSSEPYGVAANISLNEVEGTLAATCAAGPPSSRSDVRLARAQVEIAERDVRDAGLRYLPFADVGTTASYSNIPFVSGENYAWSVRGVLTVPLWDGGVRYGAARSARAAVRQRREELDAAGRQATVESRQALRGVLVADRAREIAAASRDLARDTARLAQVAYEAGSGTSFDLVESARRQREAELTLAVREFELVRARIAALLAAASCRY